MHSEDDSLLQVVETSVWINKILSQDNTNPDEQPTTNKMKRALFLDNGWQIKGSVYMRVLMTALKVCMCVCVWVGEGGGGWLVNEWIFVYTQIVCGIFIMVAWNVALSKDCRRAKISLTDYFFKSLEIMYTFHINLLVLQFFPLHPAGQLQK